MSTYGGEHFPDRVRLDTAAARAELAAAHQHSSVPGPRRCPTRSDTRSDTDTLQQLDRSLAEFCRGADSDSRAREFTLQQLTRQLVHFRDTLWPLLRRTTCAAPHLQHLRLRVAAIGDHLQAAVAVLDSPRDAAVARTIAAADKAGPSPPLDYCATCTRAKPSPHPNTCNSVTRILGTVGMWSKRCCLGWQRWKRGASVTPKTPRPCS